MVKKLLLVAVIGGLVYLNHTNPSREEHEALLLEELQTGGAVSDEQFEAALSAVDFSNFMVCSATKTALGSRMISLGYLKKVKLVNTGWIEETREKIERQRGY